jgi:dienelactone hydrolase
MLRGVLIMNASTITTLLWVTLCARALVAAAGAPTPLTPGDRALAEYFRAETVRLADQCLTGPKQIEDWERDKPEHRRQLLEMLGLWPLPERAALNAVVTGRVEHDTFAVEKLHFQSRPGLYVTANLYLPKNQQRRAPTILYLSGHGQVIKDGVSFGNKVAYHHHGVWFARNGYVCLITDTVQLGEIQGVHHGTYREGMWWWNARGYTPAGTEAWNSIRALDYLQTRPEVDTNRFGVTGRSGGGAYSWWLAAVDERVKVAAPVAGITDLHNHVVDGTVEGHCDCMFIVNTHRWDYAHVAALVAPRPLLLANSDADPIFPLDGVQRLHAKVRKVYEHLHASTNLGLLITQGPHKDTQDLQLPVFRWFNRHLKGEDPTIEMAATKFFEPEQLKVFATLPAESINARVHELFVPPASTPPVPPSKSEWERLSQSWLAELATKAFGGWPANPPALGLEQKWSVTRHGVRFQALDFTSQEHVRLRLYLVSKPGLRRVSRVELNVLGAASDASGAGVAERDGWTTWDSWLATMRAGFEQELQEEIQATPSVPAGDEKGLAALRETLQRSGAVAAYVVPRGVGLTAWSGDARKQTQIRRRFMLLGQTLDGMRVWDVRRALQAVRVTKPLGGAPISVRGQGDAACHALYASLFETKVARLELRALSGSHRDGPDYLNVLRVLDVPEAVALAARHSSVRLAEPGRQDWEFPLKVARGLGWSDERLVIEPTGLGLSR